MPTHHQKLHDLDRPVTKREMLIAMQKLAQTIDWRLHEAGLPGIRTVGGPTDTLAAKENTKL